MGGSHDFMMNIARRLGYALIVPPCARLAGFWLTLNEHARCSFGQTFPAEIANSQYIVRNVQVNVHMNLQKRFSCSTCADSPYFAVLSRHSAILCERGGFKGRGYISSCGKFKDHRWAFLSFE